MPGNITANQVGIAPIVVAPTFTPICQEWVQYQESGPEDVTVNEASEVHTLGVSAGDHQSLGHTMTHVISFWTWGQPGEALMGEGLAVCLDQSGKDLRKISNQLLAQGKLVSLDKLLGDAWFAGRLNRLAERGLTIRP
jgi:hypothetical protein